MLSNNFLNELGWLALSARWRRLSESFTKDVLQFYKDNGVNVDLTAIPILMILHYQPQASAHLIASSLGYSKAFLSQILKKLIKDGFIVEKKSEQDGRHKNLQLTKSGLKLVSTLEPLWKVAERAFAELGKKVDPDLLVILQKLEAQLSAKSVLTRLHESNSSIEKNIVIYKLGQPEFQLRSIKKLFKDYENFLGLNLDFQNFRQELASLPGKYHPLQQGQIFWITYKGESAGCCAFYKFQPGIAEVKRVFVHPKFRGLGLAQKMMHALIQEATAFGYKKLYLDSLHRLQAAEHLYTKLGFKTIKPYNTNPLPDVYHMALKIN